MKSSASSAEKSKESPVAHRPLYAQVRDKLVNKIEDAEWSAGQLLPNEFNLAREYGVSVGTIRKAVEGLELIGMVIRKQGRGTFVTKRSRTMARHASATYYVRDGEVQALQFALLESRRRTATPREARQFGLTSADSVQVLRMIGSVAGRNGVMSPVALQTLILPTRKFPGIDLVRELPQSRFEKYRSDWGIAVTRISTRFSIVPASDDIQSVLNCGKEEQIIRIERAAISTDEVPVELCVVEGRATDLELHSIAVERV
jgi:GntR family transcriptional regulator